MLISWDIIGRIFQKILQQFLENINSGPNCTTRYYKVIYVFKNLLVVDCLMQDALIQVLI